MNIYQELREKRGLSKSKLAKILGITRQELINWESGKSTPNQENAQKLADFFNVSIYEFMYELELTKDPEEAKKGLKVLNDEVAEKFSDKMEREKAILTLKLKIEKPKRYVSKFDATIKKAGTGAATFLIIAALAISSITLEEYINPKKFGSISNLNIIAERRECSENSCVFKIQKILYGNYKGDYIELTGIEDMENNVFIIGILKKDDNYKVTFYQKWPISE